MLQFDIGFGDVIVPGAVEMAFPSLLDMEEPILRAYSIESVIAEKFEAMLYLAHANSRMKDFYDIFQLSHKYNFQGNTLYQAINETLKRRKTPLSENPVALSEAFSTLPEKQRQTAAVGSLYSPYCRAFVKGISRCLEKDSNIPCASIQMCSERALVSRNVVF